MRVRRTALSTSRPGVVIHLVGLSRLSDVAHRAGDPLLSSDWPRAWRMIIGWPIPTPVGHGPTGSNGRQPKLEAGVRGTSTAAGPGGGAALGGEASVAPPPILQSVEAAPNATRDSREPCHHRVVARHRAPPPALIATLSSLERQPQILSASQPAAIATGLPAVTRQRVVLLPHVRAELIDIRPKSRRTGGVTGMDQDNSPPRDPPQRDGRTRVIAANLQWHDAELALKVARHCFERWRVAGPKDTPLPATMHAYHTHVALHEVARVIAMLIETFRLEANARITTQAPGAGIPIQRGD